MNIRYAALVIVFTWLGAHHSAHADESEPSQRAEADSTAELLESARLLVAKGDAKTAVKQLTEAIAQNPEDDEIYILRGDARWEVGTWESLDLAVEDYARAISINPKNPIAWRKRGDARREKSDDRGALADYQVALRLAPDDPVTLCCRGALLHYSFGRPDLAEADFRKALEVHPDYHQAHNNLGYLAAENGDFDTAIALCTKAVESAPDYAPAYSNRGYAFLQKKQFQRALKDLDKALELKKEMMTFMDRGDTKAAMGDFNGAIRDYTSAIEHDEHLAGHAQAYAKRGELYKRLGEDEKAREDFNRSKDYDD